ncbi:MAG: DUF4102 domain-containing protein [Proteobacteria bacterium]|nr:DUF4102 domain-containing protein [Pseudomonadota bacterium]
MRLPSVPKRIAPLTPSAVRNAKPKDRPYKLADERGLFLLVNPNGSRWWRWKYRRPESKKENLLSLGTFPDVSLKQARERREEARTLVAHGIVPGVKRMTEKTAAAAQHAETRARYLFSFAIATDGALSVTVRGNTLCLTPHQTDAIRAALLATPV